jgi:hypothetical protein
MAGENKNDGVAVERWLPQNERRRAERLCFQRPRRKKQRQYSNPFHKLRIKDER